MQCDQDIKFRLIRNFVLGIVKFTLSIVGVFLLWSPRNIAAEIADSFLLRLATSHQAKTISILAVRSAPIAGLGIRMKSLLAAVVALFVFAAMNAESAADLPVKTSPPAPADPAPYNWTGFYVGGNGGYEWTDPKSFPLTATQNVAPLAGAGPLTWQADGIYPLTSNLGQSGAIGGLQAGYNWQSSSWVTGVEADFDYSSASRSWPTAACCSVGALGATTNISRRLDALATLRARFGFAADRSLFYVTGGVAVGESALGYAAAATNVLGNVGSAFSSTTVWQAGWTLGGGIEYAPWQHWSVKAEYLYFDLGSQSTMIASNVPAIPGESWTATATVKNNGQVVRAGVNYKF